MFEINYFYNKYKPNPEVYKFHFAFEYMINGIMAKSLLFNL